MRLLFLTAAVFLTGCSPALAPVKPVPIDETTQPWYAQTVEQLTAMNAEAEKFFQTGNPNQASDLIQKGEPLQTRLLSVPRPTLPAAQAASDLDSLYGRMLLSNRHYGWARLVFQKNQVRWKHWKPQTPDSLRRLKQAEEAIAECDKRMGV